MGKIKQLLIEEQERAFEQSALRGIADRRAPRVSDRAGGDDRPHGGDKMTSWKQPNLAEQLDAILTADPDRETAEEVAVVAQAEAIVEAEPIPPVEEPVAASETPETAESAPEVPEAAESAQEPPEAAPAPAQAAPAEDPTPVVQTVAAAPAQQAVVAPVAQTTDEQADALLAAPAKRKETREEKLARLEREKPIVGMIGTAKMMHGEMILNGICSNCVRCGMKLTDAVSIERGMGPECSSKGYAEDPKNPDEMGAMIELSPWPALVDFLTKHYKPLGVRGLMNGLVRIAALNRKTAVHGACASAIEQLGYVQLAKALRDSLAVVSISESKRHPDHYEVWVKKTEYKRPWFDDMTRIPGFFFEKRGRFGKGMNLVPKSEKKRLWYVVVTHYEGLVAKTPSGAVAIRRPKPRTDPAN